MAQDISFANDHSVYSTASGDLPGIGPPGGRRRQTVFAHGAYVDATYLGDSATSPMSLDPMQMTSIIPNPGSHAISAIRSGSRVSPGVTAAEIFGPLTGNSMQTDSGFIWASEENSSMRDPSLHSYSAQSLSPALSNDQNRQQSPKLEDEDSDSSPKRSNSTPGEARKKPRRKTHNAIEKRYRVKLNEKIAELRDSIPSLRQQTATTPGGSPIGDASATDLASGQKINKANILEKATEYVKHLENCNRRLQSELQQARAEARPPLQHGSHSVPQPPYTSPEGGPDPAAFGFDTGLPARQGQGEGFYAVQDLFSNNVRPF